MVEHSHLPNFEGAVLPHLDAAYNLARWLMRNQQDAEDVGGVKMRQDGHCKTPRNLTRAFSIPILALPIQKKLCSKTTATLWCEKRSRSSRRIFGKYSFFANSWGCLTERSQMSPACPQAL